MMNFYLFWHRLALIFVLIETLALIIPESTTAATKRGKKTNKNEHCGLKKHKGTYALICHSKSKSKSTSRRLAKPNSKQCSCPRGRRGQKGARGREGPGGLTGPPGLAGTDGRDGRSGLRGIQGTPGIIGKPGLKGSIGPVGAQGPPGLSGRDGTPGPPGPPGISGTCLKTPRPTTSNIIRSSCLPGAPGPRGESGMAGQTGPIGTKGPPGDRGIDGKSGSAGSRGERGPVGSPGKIESLRCVAHFTVWFPESKWKSLTPEIGCKGTSFLQKFKLQRTSPNMRYKYTCCSFQ